MSREQKREAVNIGKEYVSERRSCELISLHRTVFRHVKTEKDIELKAEIRKIAVRRKRFGYRRIDDILNRTRVVNHKKTYRLYREMGLKYRIKSRKKRKTGESMPLVIPAKPNERWSMDFVSDTLYDGRTFRVFNVIDDCSREAIVQHVDISISGLRLSRVFDEIKVLRALPRQLLCDNGTEFTSNAFRKWAQENGIEIHYIDKGKPTQNAFVESFNGKFRDECLNEEWFANLSHAKSIIEAWRIDYNSDRPHSGLNGLSPYEFLKNIA